MFSLTLSNLRVHRVRTALTVAAIALSVSLVVAVTSGYASARAAAQKVLSVYLGTTDAQITRANSAFGGIDEQLVAEIERDPDVERADGRLEIDSKLVTADGSPVFGRALQLIGIDRPSDVAVETLRMHGGEWFNRSDTLEAVVDQVAAERLNVEVGGTFRVPTLDKQTPFTVTGIVHKPGLIAAWIQTAYVPLRTLQDLMLPQNPRQVSRIMVNLKVGADHDAFVERWKARLAEIDPNLRLRPASDNRREMDRNMQGLHMLSYLGGSVSMLAATFIVFSALSMGVAERQRTLAMLRAVGAFRSQLGWLVVCEGLMLAVAGVIVGVPLGILWIHLLAWSHELVFAAGAVLSIDGILSAVIGSILAALAASLLPAINAMRASPLEAMTPLARPTRPRAVLLCAALGLLLISIDPLILFLPLNRTIQFYGHYTIGLGSVMIGFFLLAPAFVWIIERAAGPVVAAMFGLDFSILRQQLSGGVWRAAGTCAALMVGLAILVVTQTQGTSAIGGWKLPDRFPDVFIWSAGALSPRQQQTLADAPGIRKGEIMPIAMASPEFGSNFWGIIGAAVMPNATMFFGIDPDLALEMMDLDFREGSPEEAKRMLKLGRHVIVTQEYKQLKGLGVGSTVPLKTNKGIVDFTVAGVVWSPGIDVVTGMHDLEKQFEQRTAASLFGTLDDAREYFGVEHIRLFAANLDTNIEKATLVYNLQVALGSQGLDVGDIRHIKFGIQQLLSRLLLLVSSVAYAALAVASLGVTNTIMASIRSRRWQFGILRSIGTTRSQLLRIVLAEALLLGIVGAALGLAAGFEMAINARQSWAVTLGYAPPIVVPWTRIGIGIGVVMAVSLLASLWPALHVSRTDPLSLLQAGRSAA